MIFCFLCSSLLFFPFCGAAFFFFFFPPFPRFRQQKESPPGSEAPPAFSPFFPFPFLSPFLFFPLEAFFDGGKKIGLFFFFFPSFFLFSPRYFVPGGKVSAPLRALFSFVFFLSLFSW